MTQETFFKSDFSLTLTGQEIYNLIYFLKAGRNAGMNECMSTEDYECCMGIKENLEEHLEQLYKKHVVEKAEGS